VIREPSEPARRRLRRSLPLAVVCAIDPVLRDALITDLLLDAADLVAVRYDTDLDRGGLRRLVLDRDGVLEDVPVELAHECISCAMREDALPVIEALAADPRWPGALMVLPVAADPQAVCGTLGPQLRGAHITSTTAIVDTDAARADLLGDDTLAERGLRWTDGDERSVGEALAAQLEYCDMVLADGEAEAPGAELVEHLRGHDQLLVHGVHEVFADLLLEQVVHDPRAAARRVDPRTVEPWGGPTVHGTWTLDLCSDRPFHPERFLEEVERLGSGELRGRGRFWLPTRPHSICQWDGAGGQVSIGVIGDAGADLPTTRIVVTGIGRQDRVRVRRAFRVSLLDDAEWERGLASWLGRDDGMTPWLGQASAAS